jgi:hypothetical protein
MLCKQVFKTQTVETCHLPRLLGFLAAAILILNSSITNATDRNWNIASGDWSTAVNWGGVEPSSSDNAYIQNNGTATITQSGETCQDLYLGGTNTGTVEMTGGSLSVSNYSHIGYSGTGTFTQTGGTNSITSSLDLGGTSGSSGTYNLSYTGQLSAGDEWVGCSGTGTFTQTGGTNSITSSLDLGGTSGSSGTYNLSYTGQLSAGDEWVGYSGTGTFTQTGGTNSITSSLYLGKNSGSSGTYNLNGGTLILKAISKGSGTAAFNFGGGILKANNVFSSSLAMTLTGTGGNAQIDTTGYSVTLSGVLSGTGV